MLEHGEAVHQKYLELRSAAEGGGFPASWRRPKWWDASVQKLLAEQPSLELMKEYQVFHDCGKHLCLEVDEQGKQRFPGHALASAQAWEQAGGSEDAAWLMANDMLLHSGSAEECQAIYAHRLMTALLWTALAELHANAEMFGGIESSSFKMKAKTLDRRGAQLTK